MNTRIETHCVVVGGGPAGLMLGLLLARQGVDVVVVEKHADFLRDFRGDTIHPSTQDLLAELGLLDSLLRRPHSDMARIQLSWHGAAMTLADFSHLPTRRRVMTFVPQWDFLDLIAEAAERIPNFTLMRSTAIAGIVRDADARVVGVTGTADDGSAMEITARLVVDASGRDSVVRGAAGLAPSGVAAAMDVLWFRLPHRPGESYPFIQAGSGMVITIDRESFFQVAYVIPAGSWSGTEAEVRTLHERLHRVSSGIGAAFEQESLTPADVHLLRVRLERLPRWYTDGLLCIGDAAHAMSPAGGVGINLAIQDAVAAARTLGPILRERRPTARDLRRIQRRRAWPVLVTQSVQRALQGPLLSTTETGAPMPAPLRLLKRFPALTRLVGRFVGLGARPETLH